MSLRASAHTGVEIRIPYCVRRQQIVWRERIATSGFALLAMTQLSPNRFGWGFLRYLTYSMTTRRLGSTPVEWVVMLSMSCSAAWITCRS